LESNADPVPYADFHDPQSLNLYGFVVLLRAENLPDLNDDERWQAAAMTLESILGEEELLSRINEFELVNQIEERFAARERPIQELRQAVLG
jgi:hypothetical protein